MFRLVKDWFNSHKTRLDSIESQPEKVVVGLVVVVDVFVVFVVVVVVVVVLVVLVIVAVVVDPRNLPL